uniref:Uncharacterized protein n=1 Tax=Anguilla anguilla TaxID=7936 RepID=A0A0E9XHU0_ANGAN
MFINSYYFDRFSSTYILYCQAYLCSSVLFVSGARPIFLSDSQYLRPIIAFLDHICIGNQGQHVCG